MRTLNERVTAIRKSKSMKQKDFAELIGIPRSSLSEIESGKRSPNVDLIVGISTHFSDINTNWLLTGQGDMYKKLNNEATTNKRYEMINKLFDALSERQQQEILLAIEEKERLNRLEKQMFEFTKENRISA